MKTQSLGRVLLIAASVLIVATIACVIALTPSPAEHRLVQRDAAVLSHLEELGQAGGTVDTRNRPAAAGPGPGGCHAR
ncbi:hypothetical protein ABB30_15520, partial [Stenotrophomonas ginsengisoli]